MQENPVEFYGFEGIVEAWAMLSEGVKKCESSQLGLLAKRLAADIRRTQRRNRKARVSATKRRVQMFKRMGIHCFKLISCDSVKLAL